MKKMALGRVLVFLVSVFFVLSLPHMALANAPQNVDVFYDFTTKTLVVKISHPSNNPDKHYIKEVVVKKNGAVVQRGAYTKQDGDVFTYTYKMQATAEDVIEVTATCSIQGSKTVKYQAGV
jgi:desulfoferrodoxin (superoxide reductase-like protein)